MELWTELRWNIDDLIESLLEFDAMHILKNWIWIEYKHFVQIWIESWIQKSWIVTSL